MVGLPCRVVSVVTSAVLHQAVQVFGEAVETLCLASSQRELSSELQLLRASVALGRYVKNNSPQLKSKVAGAMATFLNTRVVGWVRDQGGWVGDHLPVRLLIIILPVFPLGFFLAVGAGLSPPPPPRPK